MRDEWYESLFFLVFFSMVVSYLAIACQEVDMGIFRCLNTVVYCMVVF